MATYRRTKLAADAFRGFTSRALITKPEPAISRLFSTKSSSKPAGFSNSILHNRIPKSTHESSQFLGLIGKRHYHEHPGQRGTPLGSFERSLLSFALLSFVPLSYLMSTTETVPYTNRRHAVMHGAGRRLMPKPFYKFLDNFFDIMLQPLYEFLPASHQESVRVNLIFKDIIDALNTKLKLDGTAPALVDFDWEVAVADLNSHREVCGTCTMWSESLDGDTILVYRGCLEQLNSDAEIAAIICHEVAHTVAGHHREWITYMGIVFLPFFLALPLQCSAWKNRMELEADEIALLLMASAGYDPKVALIVYEKIKRINCVFPALVNAFPLSAKEKADKLERSNIMEEALSIYRNVRAARGVEEFHSDDLYF